MPPRLRSFVVSAWDGLRRYTLKFGVFGLLRVAPRIISVAIAATTTCGHSYSAFPLHRRMDFLSMGVLRLRLSNVGLDTHGRDADATALTIFEHERSVNEVARP